VVTSAERAKHLRHRPIYISGMGQAHSGEFMRPWRDPRYPEGTFEGGKAADIALGMAGITHKDIDIAQFYDGFTILVIIELEAYGFCNPGEGGPFVEEGRLELDGELPSNTAGGLLSEGHLMGMGHVAEAVRQLRGECGKRQVKDAEVAFVCGYGGAPHEYPISFSYSTLILTR
jgi:acetyl-CoA acetyltransferase